VGLTIEAVIEQVPDWKGRAVQWRPLAGGLTNANYRVDVDGRAYFVRIPGASTELLSIDRQNEVHNSRAAARAGVAPPLVHHLPEHDVMVLEFVSGRTLSIETMQEPGMPSRLAEALRRLHAGPRFLRDFDMFRLVDFYLQIASQHGVRIPADYTARLPAVHAMERALRARPMPAVPCNNDLLPENVLDDGERLWLIDFEYSGNNDPCFELGNTCQEAQYDGPRYAELCRGYFGEARSDLQARMHLWAVMSDVGWTLWGAIQAKISRLDFDFWAYAVGRWERALGMIDSAEFPRWLQDAADPAGAG
jgi:thiamine kinase-like enzyme